MPSLVYENLSCLLFPLVSALRAKIGKQPSVSSVLTAARVAMKLTL
jgi:hypothetical protein